MTPRQALCRIVPGDFELTPPVISLLFVNLITIALAIADNWDAATVMFIYWAQSVIIGFFTVLALLSLEIKDVQLTRDTP